MDCVDNQQLNNSEYFQRFRRKLVERRIPVSGSIALTGLCNLSCVHCYLGSLFKTSEAGSSELSTEKWLSIIDEITQAGCLFLLITGGEPLLRKDFPAIYSHAKEKGIVTTVFTNGTLITPEIVELFGDLPPQLVEISLYGSSEATYHKITGVRGVYEKCRQGLELLHAAGIPFSLKTILMTDNVSEFEKIKDVARQYDVKFRFDAAIFPRLDGDVQPIAQRVDPKTVVEKELAEPEAISRWQDFIDRQGNLTQTDKVYNCGTGLTSFHIDSLGKLQPCVLANDVTYNLGSGSFQKGWDKVIPRIRNRRIDKEQECAQCSKRILCGFCPAFFRLENGSDQVKSEYLCKMGHERQRVISEFRLETKQ